MESKGLLVGYLDAKERILKAGFEEDITWAENLQYIKPDAQHVLREAAWVVLNAGFKYKTAQTLWPRFSKAFYHFKVEKVTEACIKKGCKVLNHPVKVKAIVQIAEVIRTEGFESILQEARTPEKLARLPGIGPITCWHLAKVLGQDVLKPDVHLGRAARAAGFRKAIEMAEVIKGQLGERLTVIDSVLWRYGEQKVSQGWPDWPELFKDRD